MRGHALSKEKLAGRRVGYRNLRNVRHARIPLPLWKKNGEGAPGEKGEDSL